jgi:hypothetical protein
MTSNSPSAHVVRSELTLRMKFFRLNLSPEARDVFDEVLSAAADQLRKSGGSEATGSFFLQFIFKLVAVK